MSLWIIYSLLMFGASVVMYLFIRYGQKHDLPLMQYLLAMFVVPFVIFALTVPVLHLSLRLNWWILLVIVGASFVFSYLGNVVSQKGILLAPNPGYSLTISKSYVILTSLFAILVFHSQFTLRAGVAILLIIGFSALIAIQPKKVSNKEGLLWVILSFAACICFAGLALVSTYLLQMGIDVFVWLFYLFLFVSVFILVEMIRSKQKILPKKSQLPVVIVIGITSTLFNLFMQLGYKVAPNPGYINAANAASITLVTLLSAFFFKDELNARKVIGVIGVTCGLLLLFL